MVSSSASSNVPFSGASGSAVHKQAANAVRFPAKDSGASTKREAVQYAIQSTLSGKIEGFAPSVNAEVESAIARSAF